MRALNVAERAMSPGSRPIGTTSVYSAGVPHVHLPRPMTF